jgi:hypothetical protein
MDPIGRRVGGSGDLDGGRRRAQASQCAAGIGGMFPVYGRASFGFGACAPRRTDLPPRGPTESLSTPARNGGSPGAGLTGPSGSTARLWTEGLDEVAGAQRIPLTEVRQLASRPGCRDGCSAPQIGQHTDESNGRCVAVAVADRQRRTERVLPDLSTLHVKCKGRARGVLKRGFVTVEILEWKVPIAMAAVLELFSSHVEASLVARNGRLWLPSTGCSTRENPDPRVAYIPHP